MKEEDAVEGVVGGLGCRKNRSVVIKRGYCGTGYSHRHMFVFLPKYVAFDQSKGSILVENVLKSELLV